MIRKIPFDPRRIGSLALWLDAADATSAGAWPDRSGYQRHAMQAATNSQPALSGTINGRPALSFDGINDNLAVPPIPMVSCGIVAVCQPSASSRTLAFIAANGSPSFFVPSGDASLAAFVQGNGGAVQSPGAEYVCLFVCMFVCMFVCVSE